MWELRPGRHKGRMGPCAGVLNQEEARVRVCVGWGGAVIGSHGVGEDRHQTDKPFLSSDCKIEIGPKEKRQPEPNPQKGILGWLIVCET